MALGTSQGCGEKHFANVIDEVIQVQLPGNRLRDHRGPPGPRPEKTGGDQVLCVSWIQFITGNLLDHKLVVRLVLVKGANDIITVSPEIRSLIVIGEAGRIGVPHHIQPVLAPTFTIMGAGKQTVDQFRPGLR